MKHYFPLILALLIAPPAVVSVLQTHLKRQTALGGAAISENASDDVSVCSLDDFPSDRSKAIARAQCYIDANSKIAFEFPDLQQAAFAMRRSIAERYSEGEIRKSEAETMWTSKLASFVSEYYSRENAIRSNQIQFYRANSEIARSYISPHITCTTDIIGTTTCW